MKAIFAVYSAASNDEVIWHCYFIVYAALTVLETMLATGAFALVLCDEFTSSVAGYIAWGKLPFLLWCLHPLTYGCEVIAKQVLGAPSKLLKMDEKRFKLLFLIVVGGGVAFLL